jgi:hypothetical protein
MLLAHDVLGCRAARSEVILDRSAQRRAAKLVLARAMQQLHNVGAVGIPQHRRGRLLRVTVDA